ncbi:hypothetical protein [Sporisorium scitamineum]|uniref:LCCL domain-containing protein n=1 Tax=Sporisorium scitamineum TaxID=49012 RepID=A0A0F7S2D9_9BASI|nr:hypothetical protein [Sporisorium scitamineum]
MPAPLIPASRMRDGLQVVHDSIEHFANTYRKWLALAPAYSYGPALDAPSTSHCYPNAESLARAYCPIAGPRWDEHRERIMASTSLKGLTVLRSQVESELAALERLAAERGSWQEPHPYSNGTHHIRFWEEVLYDAFTFGPVLSIQDRFAFSMSAALRRKKKMRKPRNENINSQSVKVDVVSKNGDRWTRLYIVKPERLRQEFREAESYMVDEDDSSSASASDDDDLDTSSHTDAAADSFHEHHHTANCSVDVKQETLSSNHTPANTEAPAESLAFDTAAKKCSLTKLIHELRAAADTEARARVQRSEEHGRKLLFVPIHVEIVVTRMELQTPSQPLPSVADKGKQAALADFYQMSEWDRFNHRLAAIAQEAHSHNVDMVFGYRQLPPSVLEQQIPPSIGLTSSLDEAKSMGLPSIPQAPARPHWRTTRNINLDVTAMIALVSDTTHDGFRESATHDALLDQAKRHPKLDDGEHGSGALYQHHFRTLSIRKEALEARAAELSLQDDQQDEASRALDNAAAKEGRALAIQLEREMTIETLFDAILGPIWGKDSGGDASRNLQKGSPVQLFATVGAFDRLRRVSSTVGGPNEKRRVKALLGDAGVDPQDFWQGSKWAGPEHDELRKCLLLPIQPLQDLGPGGFESLTRLKEVYPDLPRAHFISHMIDTLESCLSELWGPDWRDISEDLPRSKYKKLRQSTVHQAGGQTYTTLRSMHACARYGMTTLTSNMDSVQWLLKETSRRPYSEQTQKILRDASAQELEALRTQQDPFYSCFIVLHPRSLSEQMRVTTTAPAWREVLEGYPGGLGPPVASVSQEQVGSSAANGHGKPNGSKPLEEVEGYSIDDGQPEDRITSSSGIMYSLDPLARSRDNEIETTREESAIGSSSRSDSMIGATPPEPIKKTSMPPLTPLGLQPEVEPIFYQDDAADAHAATNSRSGRARRARKWVLGPKPPARLGIRHYRWWPLARIERNWTRLTQAFAWKDPEKRGEMYGNGHFSDSDRQLGEQHYQDDVQPGLAWWRAIVADVKLNKLHWVVLCLVYLGWILGFAYLAKSLWYESAVVGFDGVSRTPAFLSCTSTYWLRNAECGLDGQGCEPFYTAVGQVGQAFRCPANCIDVTLLNPRAVGNQSVNYEPLVVGGGDTNGTYRADSFVCADAIHAGVIRNSKGGCGSVRLIGAYAGFEASKANGINSIGFDSAFPMGYRFESTQGEWDCTDRRWQGYVVNAIMSAVVGFVLRPKRIVWFWTLACVGYWHINLVSYPRDYPPPIGSAMGTFLPFLFTCYAIWRLAFRVMWKTGWLAKYVSLYIVGGVLIGLAAAVPTETLRLHHYIIALVLLPACAFPTRLCLVYTAFCLGMFTNGVARWGFDGLLEDDAVVQGDATGGTARPTFNTTASTWAASQGVVRWNAIPSNLTTDWDGYALLVDDVLRYQGSETSFNLSSSLLDVYAEERLEDGQSEASMPSNTTLREVPHYLRVAYSSQGSAGDFTRAATAWLADGMWKDASPGAT